MCRYVRTCAAPSSSAGRHINGDGSGGGCPTGSTWSLRPSMPDGVEKTIPVGYTGGCWSIRTRAPRWSPQTSLRPMRFSKPMSTASIPSRGSLLPPLPALSKYAWIVREQQRLCTRAGLPVDVCELVRQACPALSGEAQDSIVRELAQYQRAAQQAMALHRLGELGTGEDGLAALSLETLECAACGAAGPACVCREDCEDG